MVTFRGFSMKCFILNRSLAKEEYFTMCEPRIYTARGSCCGQYVAFVFKDDVSPKELGGGMSEEELINNMRITPEWAVIDG